MNVPEENQYYMQGLHTHYHRVMNHALDYLLVLMIKGMAMQEDVIQYQRLMDCQTEDSIRGMA